MCLFINLVAAPGDEGALRAACERQGKRLVPSTDDGVLAVLEAGESAWLTTQTCDCESRLLARTSPRDADEKLAKKGWSAAKIARWKEQRGAKAQGAETVRVQELERWQAILDEALAAGVKRVGLVAHWASEGVRRGATKPLAALEQDELVFWPGR